MTGGADPTASGLDETAIAAEDIAALRSQFRFSSLAPDINANLHVLEQWELPSPLPAQRLRSAALAIRAVGALRLRMAPLPTKVKGHTLRWPQSRLALHRDLPPALAQPVRRMRTLPTDLTAAEQAAVNQAFADKHGSAAKQLTLQAVYREVPPEVAKTVRLDEALRFCQFLLPPNTPVAKLRSGYALAVATGESGKTYPVLVRL